MKKRKGKYNSVSSKRRRDKFKKNLSEDEQSS